MSINRQASGQSTHATGAEDNDEREAALLRQQLKEANRQVVLALDARTAQVNARAHDAQLILTHCEVERTSLDAKRNLIQQVEKLQIELLADGNAVPTISSRASLVSEQVTTLTEDDALRFTPTEDAPKRSFPAALFPSRVNQHC